MLSCLCLNVKLFVFFMVEHSWADLVDMGPADASICSALRFIR